MEEPRRISAKEIAVVRQAISELQGGRCAICQGLLGDKAPLDACLDHNHSTGAIRGVLHRGCNSVLGLVENNAKRYGVFARLIQFCAGLAGYLRIHEDNVTNLLHPSHKTAEEKRILRNTRARKASANRRKKREED
ncbi:35L [Xanthomonas phage Xp10]|uniref:35L n=1 Tax=Xanthomonas phage Xp10 TaxID=2907956 RepID=Q7Y5I1_9CAUD|nr:endonuclease VII [Xanthomonas phage Xp10]AAP58703.1 35L [Xanthomonas phage Xp10]